MGKPKPFNTIVLTMRPCVIGKIGLYTHSRAEGSWRSGERDLRMWGHPVRCSPHFLRDPRGEQIRKKRTKGRDLEPWRETSKIM